MRCYPPCRKELNHRERGLTGNCTGSTGTSTQKQPQPDLPNGIWVRNFVFDVNEDHLREMFSKFGNVVEVRIVRDPRGLSRGCVMRRQKILQAARDTHS